MIPARYTIRLQSGRLGTVRLTVVRTIGRHRREIADRRMRLDVGALDRDALRKISRWAMPIIRADQQRRYGSA